MARGGDRLVLHHDIDDALLARLDRALELLSSLTGYLRERLKLMVNQAKSAVARGRQRKCLG